MRFRNTTRSGGRFSSSTIQAVWNKAPIAFGYDSSQWRRDKCGALIMRSAYGNTSSSYGWEIDHDRPVSKGGSDDLYNLQALQWENNRHKADNYPIWSCKYKAA